jgi:hypothetical protein
MLYKNEMSSLTLKKDKKVSHGLGYGSVVKGLLSMQDAHCCKKKKKKANHNRQHIICIHL